ncbi:M81 family metallopeptidase [Telmatospirillum siberiense]|uniref:Microcystinase C n=1 Tax=Telmatospirillum siberiense TaxID=382514 RepID=A0A2N3PNU5_9PROT|nr:M81 family metallopeptidase [Telmatospirillum siberiense]PKU22079.1 microcystin degradation protein MlrC [Telmatospirillum siberiense]
MRFVIARMHHETNTFSPIETPLESFSPRWQQDALRAGRGSRTAMDAFLAFAEEMKGETATPVFASASPSAAVPTDAYEQMCIAIIEAVRTGCDAVLLDLHGAMVTEKHDDGEGELLARIRAIAPSVPIGIALDLHANISHRMVSNADVLVGFKTYPHVDMYETGEHVTKILRTMIDTGKEYACAFCRPPQLAHTLKMNTSVPGAMREVIAAARAAEKRHGVHAVSIFGGFPIADIADTGMSVVVYADDHQLAAKIAREIGALLWERRTDFVYEERPLTESVAAAREAAERNGSGPVLLLDHGDNCNSGGTCDTMDVFEEAMRQQLSGIIIGPICDRQAVAAATAAGVGATLTLEIGNRTPMPAIGIAKTPLSLTGTVKVLGDGQYVITGPTYTGMRCSMGRAAVIDTGRALMLVTERPHEPWDHGVFTSVGIDFCDCRFLILKSRMYFRPAFEPSAKAVVDCASLGVTSSDYSLFRFEKLSRPIYPLDRHIEWRATAMTIPDRPNAGVGTSVR